jgi:hypothetical protein
MVRRIKLPNNPKMKGCYDLVRKQTPDLSREFNGKLLAAANGTEPADVRFRKMPEIAAQIWKNFLSQDAAHNSRVVMSSWRCCLGDLADALLQKAIAEITSSDEPKDIKRARLEALLSIAKTDLYDTPTNPGMVLELTMALNNLG